MMFTIAFTSAPVVVQGITEQPFSKEELVENPFHYRNLMGNRLMSFRKCFRWIVIGIWHVLLGYYVPRFVWLQGLSGVHDYGAFSLYISSIVVLIADTKVRMVFKYIN
jgi:magnesium-transporting ATPase (P-type)